jgi:hypothetical protein
MADTIQDIMARYSKVQKTGEEGAGGANKLQPSGGGPMDLDTIQKKYEQPSTMSDIGQTILGLPRTGAEALSGMGGNIFDMESYVAGKVMAQLGYTPEEIAAKQAEWDKDRLLPNSGEVRQQNTELLTEAGLPQGIEEASRYQPKTRGGQIAQTAGLLAPGLISGGGSLPANLISRVGVPLAGIEGGAEIGKAMGDETLGRLIGGLGSMAVPATWNRASRPFPAEPGRQDLARILDREGVPISAGQATGNEALISRENAAGGVPALQEQGPAFDAAAARTQGGFPPGTNTFSREAMSTELDRMGTEFDRMARISNAPMDNALLNQMTDIVARYRENPLVGGRVERIVNDLFDNSQQQGGRITGRGYQQANSEIGRIIRETEDNAERTAMVDLKNALDDAVERNLPPAEQDSWRTVRQQYRDYLPIEKAKAQSSPTAARGVITPSALRTGIKSVEGTREVASGDRPMTELAEAGQGIMERQANPASARSLREDLGRQISQALMGGAGVSGAAAVSGMPPVLAGGLGLAAGVGTALSQPLRNAFLRSEIGQAMARRQGPVFPAGARAGLASIMAAEQARQDGGPR